MSDSVPDLLVEKLVLGELDAVQAQRVRARLGDTAEARIAAIDASNAEILAALPPRAVAQDVARRAARATAQPAATRPSWMPWLATAGLATAAVLLWFVLRPPTPDGASRPTEVAMAQPPGPDGTGDAIRFKGDTKLMVFRQADGQPERLDAESRAAVGDRLQLEYAAGDAKFGVIVSIDGAGEATLHFPETEGGDPSLRGQAALSHGYELDDAPRFERFFFVTTASDDGLRVADVMAAARALAASDKALDGDLKLPAALAQQSLVLRK